jgi:hypothetical protein
MRRVHPISAWVLCAAGALAGCEKMDWWKPAAPPASPQAEAQTQDANLTLTPDQVAQLQSENALLKAQLEDAQVRDRQLSEQVKDLQFLTTQQEKQIKILAEAPVERDKFKAQVEELQAQNLLLRERIRLLTGGAPAAADANQPAPAPSSRPAQPTSAPAGA